MLGILSCLEYTISLCLDSFVRYLYNEVTVGFVGRILVSPTAVLVIPLQNQLTGLSFSSSTSVVLLEVGRFIF